ncbi:hypothetical protein BDZ89DRAFT_971330 [Hymenopellis radicata]|nr:hypothetical protein BDZ89DRAFT_971330 [Hymenopellis radicata]
MPFSPVHELDDLRLQETSDRICSLFQIPSLRPHQLKTGRNTLLGHDIVLDSPTGSGKTYAAYYPLFYFWNVGDTEPTHQKIILFLGPLVGLMKAQVRDLSVVHLERPICV